MTEVLETRVDETFPKITVEMARAVFEAIRPGLTSPAPDLDESTADAAWSGITRLAWAMPFADLGDVLSRLQVAEGPHARDAEYAFTWAIYHSRAEGEEF